MVNGLNVSSVGPLSEGNDEGPTLETLDFTMRTWQYTNLFIFRVIYARASFLVFFGTVNYPLTLSSRARSPAFVATSAYAGWLVQHA